jgi:hypothetical protein
MCHGSTAKTGHFLTSMVVCVYETRPVVSSIVCRRAIEADARLL